ncbi:hypothetical protein DRO31_07270 [Candidatus Bathyarchaeota archaeon]|nr:MAG: hypothetical protein DRO31_07270 [Candidatus Bathyarchaeota archaeon]
MNQVIDASTLLTLVKKQPKQAATILKETTTIPLIIYEIGNALKTMTTHLKQITPEEAEATLRNIHKALELVKITNLENSKTSTMILRNSIKYNITYYDSAYLTAAITQEATLVTEDKKLAKAAKKARLPTKTSQDM